MTDSFVTQCPHCQTSFRVSHAQLSVARGVVRCGSCLQVFNAAKQLLEQRASDTQTPAPSTPTVETAPPAALPATLPVLAEAQPAHPTQAPALPDVIVPPTALVTQPAPRQLDVDSLDLDDLDVELARLEQREIQLPESFGRAGNRRDVDHVESMSAHRGDPAHEDWNEDLANDDVDHLPQLHAKVIDPREDDARLDTPFESDDADLHTRDDHRTEPSFSSRLDDLDDEPANPRPFLDRELDDEHNINPGHSFGHARDTDEAFERKGERRERFSALEGDDAHREHQDDDDLARRTKRSRSRNRNEPGLRDEALLDLMDDPLQLDWQKPKPRWGRRMLWLLLVLVALGALAGQYVWYHFEELARQDQYRPILQELCPQLGCKVPSKVDIKLLKSSNLVVRSHPEFQGALVVDAIIYNRASFSQPFPLLELRFADTGGQLIASRSFKPAEYLSGELAGKEEMPPQTPIHIALDILDPGTKAVNYSLSFRSPE
ncbi:DUF3426 domain-containing protein [Pseudomonas huanghezhanensis]|uniref:DUF3426 domain-containing protein n=1 Tax=Pseudomonas huanghezhanensis TaxID=3002903 RepID=UPI002285577E|nr:DUF3426 domain-containing protein [Pseudomonas sp. BSw22131]